MEHEAGKPVSGDSELQSCTLESLTTAVRYHAWLTDLVRPYLGEHPLEIGSGLGDYAQTWIDSGTPQITVSDRDPGQFALLQQKFEGTTGFMCRMSTCSHPTRATTVRWSR